MAYHPPLGLGVLDGETGALGAASGEVGVEEDVDAHKEDGIDTADASPEGVSLGCSAITWGWWEERADEGHRVPLSALAYRPATGGSKREA